MPITGPTSYVVTTDQFLNHWADANDLLGASPLVLGAEAVGAEADVPLAGLDALKSALEDARDAVEGAVLSLGLLRGDVFLLKEVIHKQLNDFNDAVRADLPNSSMARVLPAVPNMGDGRERFMKPMRDAAKLWVKVSEYKVAHGSTALVLRGDVGVAAFVANLVDLRGKYDDVEEAEQQWALELAVRNGVQEQIYAVLKGYRAKLPTLFAEGAAIVETLPLLTPLPGSTPQAPGLAGTFSPSYNRAEFTGVASTSASVVRHQLRICLAEEFDQDLEQIVGSVLVGQPLTFLVTTGLGSPGSVISAKLYAMTDDGHEAGSATVVVTRPV